MASAEQIKVVFGSQDSNNWLLTTAIGGEYYKRWSDTVLPYWLEYAERHGLGVAVAVGELFRADEPELNGAWQKMLAPRALRETLGKDVRVALIDTDVLMAGQARCIFEHVPLDKFAVISQRNGLPFPAKELRQRVALYRRTFLDPTFPIESILTATPGQVFAWAGLPSFDDYFCSGVLVLDTNAHADLFAGWYREAPQDERYQAIGAWEQDWLNACVQSRDDVAWLDYSWQALWMYEVAALYPFLYAKDCSSEVAQWCLAASLLRNDFVHLAGRWESGLLSGTGPAFPQIDDFRAFAHQLSEHQKTSTTAVMRGTILPPTA